MNKLWVRLTLAFGLVTIVGLITVAILSRAQISNQFLRFVVTNQLSNPNLHEALLEYYVVNNNWRGVEDAFQNFDWRRGRRRNDSNQRSLKSGPPRASVMLTDTDGKVVYNQRGGGPNQISEATLEEAVPVEQDGQTIGYLIVEAPPRSELTSAAQAFLSRINTLLLQAGLIAGILGILLGLTISRGVTAPLSRLATAARRLSQGQLGEKVPVRGAKEMADLAEAFNDMSEALAEAEQLRRNLIADVAHELRTPLSVIQGNLRAILDDVYELDKTEVARLYDQTRLLNRLVNDLHELAQAEAKQLPMNMEPTDLSGLVTTAAETFSPVAELEGVQLTTDVERQGVTVQADSSRLKQVLHNLLTNSLRHTGSGGTISIKLKQQQDDIFLEVADTGEGISADHLPHIFDRFYRADLARARDKGGAGLGLPIVRAIVNAHNGHIQAASSGIPGQGSQFTITLPVYSSTLSA